MLSKPIFKLLIIFLLILLLLPHFASAEIYKWINEDGTIGFTDNINKVPEQYRNNVEIKEYKDDTSSDSEVLQDSASPQDSSIKDESINEETQGTEKKTSPEDSEKPDNEGQ